MNIFIDMDGVLVNFVEGTYRAFGKKYDYASLQKPFRWNYYEDWNISFLEFDSICTKDFWAGLRWMHDGLDILRLIENNFSDDNIYLLSTPMPNSGSWTGKRLWVERHLPEYKKRLIITEESKKLFAGSNSILIDDKNENVESFIKAGGRAILVPRPWNKEYGTLTLQYLKRELINIKESE